MNREIINLAKLAISAMAVLLAGCASAPSAPVRIEVPVIVPCLGAVPKRPVYEFDKLEQAAADGEFILALARDLMRSRKYALELEATLGACN